MTSVRLAVVLQCGTDASAFWVQFHLLTAASQNSILDRVGRTEAQRRA